MAVQSLWSSRLAFVLATIGFSVGLGNIWRFPYLTGESGGGAFVLVYLVCVIAIALPVTMGELMIGRLGRASPPRAFSEVSRRFGGSGLWALAGGAGVLAAFLIITYYAVIGGWTVEYTWLAASGQLNGVEATQSKAINDAFLADPVRLIAWQTVFLGLTGLIVAQGLNAGVEKAAVTLMPLLFVMLAGLAVYALATGDSARALSFLFTPDFSKITPAVILAAAGQAFFSVGVGMAAMMMYGAYLGDDVYIPGTATIVVFADTLVAVVAGLAIFPLVFGFGLEPGQGPNLIFVTLPVAFAQAPGGQVVATAFFALTVVAALTSAIALFEVLAAWASERGIPRWLAVLVAGLVCWAIGLATVFSFNLWSDVRPFAAWPRLENATWFDAIDFFASSVLLPVGAMLASLFAGWRLSGAIAAKGLGLNPQGVLFQAWRWAARVVAPAAILLILVFGVRG